MRKLNWKIATVLLVSRTTYLDRVIESLLNQTYKFDSLIVVFDGHEQHYTEVRNKIVKLPLDNVLCVLSTNIAPADTIPDRRRHIVNIHNQVRGLLGEYDWVFSVEDDGIVPPDALEKLVTHAKKNKNLGMVTGVELGRWGTPYVGAWKVDDVYSPTQISSLLNKSSQGGFQEIDGCGLYCALIRADKYKEHQFFTNNGLGPDVNLGLFLRQAGFKNYIDWSIHVTHLTHMGGEYLEIKPTDESRVVVLTLLHGNTWKH